MSPDTDRRFMEAAIRLSETHLGLTGTNPSVGALIVRHDGDGSVIVGQAVTAKGGRPHAETVALSLAGQDARGATAYVTLEPCSHHGETPPCTDALIAAGVSRVVTAIEDPDPRVAGKGHDALAKAGISVSSGIAAGQARLTLASYLTNKTAGRPHVTLKLALSADDLIGIAGGGQVAITGPLANAQTHLLRARSDAILVGVGTVKEDDPMLDCRLPGLEARSPVRIVLDRRLETPPLARIVRSAGAIPVWLMAGDSGDPAMEERARRLAGAGCHIVRPSMNGRYSLGDVIGFLAGEGLSSLLVEGGAQVAGDFISAGMVDRIVLFQGVGFIGKGVLSPVTFDNIPSGFSRSDKLVLGADRMQIFEKV